jgi:ABC-2 type transport system permease protein
MNVAATGRLSTFAAALVMARRDFTAILFSRSFFFFLLGPLFPLLVGGLAGGVGKELQSNVARPELGVAMAAADAKALIAAHKRLEPQLGHAVPELVMLQEVRAGETFDAADAMQDRRRNLAAVVTGTLQRPVLSGPDERIADWRGPLAVLAAEAQRGASAVYPNVELTPLKLSTTADQVRGRMVTAQLGQTVLFMLTMLLAGMVLSNLVEEKGNKIIEVLAAAIPMDAVFLGKLFAMLAVSLVGISVWAMAGSAIWFASGNGWGNFPAPAVGWPLFFLLGTAYFAMGYLLLGSLFLAIGSMAATVREVQTLSMPVTMLQLLNFFFASWAVAKPGSVVEMAAMIVPFSSPFTMLARAARDAALLPHALALAWQGLCVAVIVRIGAALFRRWVMKSGPAQSGGRRPWTGLFKRQAVR